MSNMQIDQVLAQIRSLSVGSSLAAKAPSAAAGAAPNVSAFSEILKKGLDAVNNTQQSAATVADQYERGIGNVDLATVMLESQKASVSFRALTEVRNRLVSVYQDIMNMPV
jgi:flagellar hook-basal body complex protein FliE